MDGNYMRAIGLAKHGDTSVLQEMDLPVPEIGPRDLLVKVKAVSMNPVDTKIRKDGLGAKKSGDSVEGECQVLGYDASGVVQAVGSEVIYYKPGDEVFYAGSVIRPGTNSELHAVDERIVGRKPANATHAEAASLPLVSLTAWESMVEGMGIPVATVGADLLDKVLLVVAGAGGVGSIAVQIAKRVLRIKTVIATASREETIDFCKKMGADIVINHHNDYKTELEAHGISGVDYVMNCIDLDVNYDQITDILKPLAKIAAITFNPSNIHAVDIQKLFMKRCTIVMEVMFTRSLFSTPDMDEQRNILNCISRLVEDGTIVPTDTEILKYSLQNIVEAHKSQEKGSSIGKTVLIMDEDEAEGEG